MDEVELILVIGIMFLMGMYFVSVLVTSSITKHEMDVVNKDIKDSIDNESDQKRWEELQKMKKKFEDDRERYNRKSKSPILMMILLAAAFTFFVLYTISADGYTQIDHCSKTSMGCEYLVRN